MNSEPNSTRGTPIRSTGCGRFVVPIFFGAFILFAVIRLSAGDTLTGLLLVVIAFTLLLVIPAGFIARRVFRGRLGELIRGEDIDHPVISTKRFYLSLRESKRPFWVTALLFVLGWIVMIFIIGLAMQ